MVDPDQLDGVVNVVHERRDIGRGPLPTELRHSLVVLLALWRREIRKTCPLPGPQSDGDP